MTIKTVNIEQLVVSPANVRTNAEDKTDIKQLAASIAAHGLLQPLVVVQTDETEGEVYEVVAGGRRHAALTELKWADPIPVTVIDGEGAVEASLAENLVRKAMRPYELYEAIGSLALSQKAIAARFALPIQTVREAQRLGRLHPDVMAAYKAGEINDDMAQAFAATADTDRQKAVFDKIGDGNNAAPWRIRELLGFRNYNRMLMEVGEEAYTAAGGRFESDLFGESKRVMNEDILEQLHNAHLAAKSKALAETYGCEVVDELPDNAYRQWGGTPVEDRTYVVYEGELYWLDEREPVEHDELDKDHEFEDEPEPERVQLTQKATAYMEEARRERFFNTVLVDAEDAVLFLLFSLTHNLKEQEYNGRTKPEDELAAFDDYVANGNHQADACSLLLGRYTGKAVTDGAFSGWAARQPQLEWTSTEEFWALFRKAQIIEMLEPVAPTFARVYHNEKQGEVREKAHALCIGEELLAIPKEERVEAQAWVPTWLRFEAAEGEPAVLDEAA